MKTVTEIRRSSARDTLIAESVYLVLKKKKKNRTSLPKQKRQRLFAFRVFDLQVVGPVEVLRGQVGHAQLKGGEERVRGLRHGVHCPAVPFHLQLTTALRVFRYDAENVWSGVGLHLGNRHAVETTEDKLNRDM